MCQLNIPFSLNLHFGYFCIRIFFVKGCFKLQKVDSKEFSLVILLIDVVLKLCQGVFKNWCIDITCHFVNRCRFFVDCVIDDVISTFKELTCHCPTKWFNDKQFSPHLLFLQPTFKCKHYDDIQFITFFISCNQLHHIVDVMMFDFHSLKEKNVDQQNWKRGCNHPYGKNSCS